MHIIYLSVSVVTASKECAIMSITHIDKTLPNYRAKK